MFHLHGMPSALATYLPGSARSSLCMIHCLLVQLLSHMLTQARHKQYVFLRLKTDCTVSHYEGYLWLITGSVTPNQPAALKQCLQQDWWAVTPPYKVAATDGLPSHPNKDRGATDSCFALVGIRQQFISVVY